MTEEEMKEMIARRLAELKKKNLIDEVKANRHVHLENLIKDGADVNQTDEDGFTPLMHAVKKRSAHIVKILLENGAKDTINVQTPSNELTFDPNYDGNTALHTALKNFPKDEISSYENMIHIIKLLLENGANINLPDGTNHTPLEIAMMYGLLEIQPLTAVLFKHDFDHDTFISLAYKLISEEFPEDMRLKDIPNPERFYENMQFISCYNKLNPETKNLIKNIEIKFLDEISEQYKQFESITNQAALLKDLLGCDSDELSLRDINLENYLIQARVLERSINTIHADGTYDEVIHGIVAHEDYDDEEVENMGDIQETPEI